VIRLLLEQKVKAEVNDCRSLRRVGGCTFTALHCATVPFVYRCETPTAGGPCARAVPAVRTLLEAGAEVDARDGQGRTPLMLAMLAGEPEVTRELLAWCANPELEDAQGKTALQLEPRFCLPRETHEGFSFHRLSRQVRIQELAAIHREQRVRADVEAAVGAGIPATWPRPLALLVTDYLMGGRSASAGAGSGAAQPVESKQVAAPRDLVELPRMRELDARLVGAISRGVPQDAGAEVARLLAGGADVNARFHLGFTPLMLLASSDRWAPTLAGLLVGQKAIQLDLESVHGTTALMAAATFQNPGMLKLLLAHGADPSRADRFRKTALELAPAGSESRRVLQDWVGQGRPRVALQTGAAPAAATAGRDPRVEHKAAAPVESKDRPGPVAEPGPGRPSTVDEDFVRAFLMGLRDDQILEARRQLDAGANVNYAFARGRTLLMLVAGRDTVPERLASLLLTHESLQVDLRDEEGRTALMVAAQKGHAGLVETLLALGADPGLKDKDDETALTLAAPDSKARQVLQAALD